MAQALGDVLRASITIEKVGKKAYSVESEGVQVISTGVEGALRAAITMLSRALFDSACEAWSDGLEDESAISETAKAHRKLSGELD